MHVEMPAYKGRNQAQWGGRPLRGETRISVVLKERESTMNRWRLAVPLERSLLFGAKFAYP